MADSPYSPPEPTTQRHSTDHLRALGLTCGVTAVGTCITIPFVQHRSKLFEAFTSLVPLIWIPVVIAAYGAILAAVRTAAPKSKITIVDEAIFTGMIVVGGLMARHVLTLVAKTLC